VKLAAEEMKKAMEAKEIALKKLEDAKSMVTTFLQGSGWYFDDTTLADLE
jgi:predicted nucleic acid-binding Zn ribbon protein